MVTIEQLSNNKDLEILEKGTGFVTGDNQIFSGLVHPAEDIKFVGYLQFIPDNPRGNHFHFRSLFAYFPTVTPSIPGDFLFFNSLKHSFRKSSVSKCANDVNLHLGSSLAFKAIPGICHRRLIINLFQPPSFLRLSNFIKFEYGWHGLDGSSRIYLLSVRIRVIRAIRVQSEYYS